MYFALSPHPSRRPWRLLWLAALWASLPLCLGIDPLPPELRDAPRQKQMQYIQRVGEEAQRQRAEVANNRHEENLRFRQSVAEGLTQELEARRQEMFGAAGPDAAPPPSSQGPESGRELATNKFSPNLGFPFGMLVLCILVYHFRERILRRLQP